MEPMAELRYEEGQMVLHLHLAVDKGAQKFMDDTFAAAQTLLDALALLNVQLDILVLRRVGERAWEQSILLPPVTAEPGIEPEPGGTWVDGEGRTWHAPPAEEYEIVDVVTDDEERRGTYTTAKKFVVPLDPKRLDALIERHNGVEPLRYETDRRIMDWAKSWRGEFSSRDVVKEVGMSRNGAHQALLRLEKAGLIRLCRITGKTRKWRSYLLTSAAPASGAAAPPRADRAPAATG